MASTSISDAVVFPQDDGTGVPDGSESYDSAGYLSTLAQSTGEAWHNLSLSNLDTTNETVDVSAGVAFVAEDGNTVQSGAQTTYDTTLPAGEFLYAVVFPTATTVSLDADTSANLRVVVDSAAVDGVTIEHNTAPTDPALVIGSADSSTSGTASESNTGPVVDAADVNGVRYADPGEVQTVIDEAASQSDVGIGYDKARSKVALKSGTKYDEGAEVVVKPGVTLVGNGANIGNHTNGGDHNIIRLDNGATIEGHLRVGIDQTVTYTSDAVVFDSDASTQGKYGIGGSVNVPDTHSHMRNGYVEVIGDLAAASLGGTGVAFRGAEATAIGVNINMTIAGMANGVYADQTATFTNFDSSRVTVLGCTNLIRQGPNSNQFKTPMDVTLQPTAPTERMIYNEGSGEMPVTTGAHWDPGNCGANALVGANMNLRQEIMTTADWSANTDGTNSQVVIEAGAFPGQGYQRIYHPASGSNWGYDPRAGNLAIVDQANSAEALNLGTGGNPVKATSGRFEAGAGGASFPHFRLPGGGGIYEATDGDPEAADDAGNTSTIGSL